MNRGEILERTGAQDWEELEREFGGVDVAEVVETIWPGEANEELVSALEEELAR